MVARARKRSYSHLIIYSDDNYDMLIYHREIKQCSSQDKNPYLNDACMQSDVLSLACARTLHNIKHVQKAVLRLLASKRLRGTCKSRRLQNHTKRRKTIGYSELARAK